MARPDDLASIAKQLLPTRELLRTGFTPRSIAAAVRFETLVRLRRGWYVSASFWSNASPRQQHFAALIVAQWESEHDPVFSHRSAATIYDLPVWSNWLESVFGGRSNRALDLKVVEVAQQRHHGETSEYLIRHRVNLPISEPMSRYGLKCTSVEQTVIDLARTEPFGVALACTDALIRQEFRVGRQLNMGAWQDWRSGIIAHTRKCSRHPGMAVTRALVTLADPRSDSPLESVSRLRFLQMGIKVELQVPVIAEDGGMLYLDFRIPKLGIFGECDGKMKYTDSELLKGESADEVFEREKRRHDWVVGVTKMRGIRWGARDASTLAAFSRRMHSFGVVPSNDLHGQFDAETIAFIRRLR